MFDVANAWIQGFLNSVGAAVFVPVIMIIMGLVVKMKVKDALSSGLLLGVAFTGMSMLISYMSGIIQPVGQAMLERVGIDLPILDGGWTTMAAIAWSWPYAVLMFPLMVVINIIMLTLNKTKVFNADLWNVWGKIFTAIGVEFLTGNILIAFLVAAVQIIFELSIADLYQEKIEELTGIPGVTCTHKMVFLTAIFYPIDKVLRKIPGLNKKSDAAALKEKVGIFAENHVLGFIVGCLFGILGGYNIGAILSLGVQAAMCLTLFPVISKYFMEALSPISEAISDYMNKKFEGKQLVVGLDWPFLGGSNEIWLAIIYSIPIALAVPAYLVTGGNLIRMLILCTIGCPVFLYVGTQFAAAITKLAVTTNAVQLGANQMISNSSIDGPWFTYAISQFLDFLNGNWVPLIMLVVWVLGYFYQMHDMKKASKEKVVQ